MNREKDLRAVDEWSFLADDPDVIAPIRFLRQREVVHYQRFGEGLRLIEEALDDRDPYARNPAFDA